MYHFQQDKNFDVLSWKKEFKADARMFYNEVMADWHNGAEDYAETLVELYKKHLRRCQKIAQSAQSIGQSTSTTLSACLVAVFDARKQLEAVPGRGLEYMDEDIEGFGELKLSYEQCFAYTFHAILLRAGAEGSSENVDIVLRNASLRFNHLMNWDFFTDAEHDDFYSEYPIPKLLHEHRGLVGERLALKEFEKIPDEITKYKERKIIDRRYQQPKKSKSKGQKRFGTFFDEPDEFGDFGEYQDPLELINTMFGDIQKEILKPKKYKKYNKKK
jgi:hypothetical protein